MCRMPIISLELTYTVQAIQSNVKILLLRHLIMLKGLRNHSHYNKQTSANITLTSHNYVYIELFVFLVNII